MKANSICEYCGHQLLYHSHGCDVPNCDCTAFVPKGQSSPQLAEKIKKAQTK